MDPKALGKALALVVVMLGVVAQTPAMATSTCATASIDEPFLLPDGEVHEAGQLKICLQQRYSPVASFHETRVDGMRTGMFVTRHQELESGDAQSPFLVFVRDDRGRLCLLGYARPGAKRTQFFAFDQPSVAVEIGDFRLATQARFAFILISVRA